MCAHVFTNHLMGEGMYGKVFEKGCNVSTDFGQQVCYGAQTTWLLKQTRVCTRLNFLILWGNARFKGVYGVGDSERLYLPVHGLWGRKRATCSWEFRIKGGCAVWNLKREIPVDMCPSELSPFIQINLRESSVSFLDINLWCLWIFLTAPTWNLMEPSAHSFTAQPHRALETIV